MRGFIIDIATQDDTTGLLFNLYDNDEKVVSGIGVLHFEYLTGEDYAGIHTLFVSYYREGIPEVESIPEQFYTANFTLPTLSLTFQVELLS